MKINNKQIQGIFLYNETIEFTYGDFVIDEGCIYTCISDSVSGKKPSEDTVNYRAYLAEKTASLEDYYDYVNNSAEGINKDLYITSQVLCGVLQNIMFGVDNRGIIQSPEELGLDSGGSVIDAILHVEDWNSGMVKVSREVAFRDFFGPIDYQKSSEYAQTNYPEEDKKSVILKQYTYLDTGENRESLRYRIQEIIDHVTGRTWYRYSKGTLGLENKWEFNSASPWKRSTIFQKDLDEFNKINDNYKTLKENYIREIDSLKTRFKFNSISLKNYTTSVEISIGDGGVSSKSLITVVSRDTLATDSNIWKSYSTTFSIAEFFRQDSSTSERIYKLSDTLFIEINKSSDAKIMISLVKRSSSGGWIGSENGEIVNIYYQNTYGE